MSMIVFLVLAFVLYLQDCGMKERFSACRSRTFLDAFPSNREIWSDVEHWAKEEGYKLKSQSEMEKVYKKGSIQLLIFHIGYKVHVEAWMAIFRQEVAVDDAVLLGIPAFKKNVVKINELLVRLGSPVKIRESYRSRTCLPDFSASKDIWSDVKRWARKEGYTLKSRSGQERIYKKKEHFWVNSGLLSHLLIRQDGHRVHVETWIEGGLLTEIGWLFVTRHRPEIAADEADMLGRTDRFGKKIWQENVNKINELLATLGSPTLIESVNKTSMKKEI